MPRGGHRTAGPGKRIGRPKKPKQELISDELGDEMLRRRLARWNIGPTQFKKQLEEQQGRCAVCAELLTDGWVVDHDHMTLQVRGLLHARCNQMLGLAKDDPARLERAAEYLRKHNRFLS
jgi:Recombination endonuclease VII